jgi:peptidoglycan/xylan/chitin deacetylase (PgdA/CDA1 family)
VLGRVQHPDRDVTLGARTSHRRLPFEDPTSLQKRTFPRAGYLRGRRSCENNRVNPWIIASPAVVAAVAGVTAYGAVHPGSQLFGPTIRHTASPRDLAITFDDGPNPAMTPKLLDLLQRSAARATFFLIGRYVRECPDLVREISARGHTIGCHTDTHPNLLFAGPRRIHDELLRGSDAIASVTGALPKWFRPPWGFRNPWLAPATRELNLRVVMWSVLPSDWRAPSAAWLIDRMQPISTRASANAKQANATGDILCLHDGYHARQNGDRTYTLAALEHCLPRWRDLGLKFATIDQAVTPPA